MWDGFFVVPCVGSTQDMGRNGYGVDFSGQFFACPQERLHNVVDEAICPGGDPDWDLDGGAIPMGILCPEFG